jgi:hypothetical protein
VSLLILFSHLSCDLFRSGLAQSALHPISVSTCTNISSSYNSIGKEIKIIALHTVQLSLPTRCFLLLMTKRYSENNCKIFIPSVLPFHLITSSYRKGTYSSAFQADHKQRSSRPLVFIAVTVFSLGYGPSEYANVTPTTSCGRLQVHSFSLQFSYMLILVTDNRISNRLKCSIKVLKKTNFV